MEQMKSIHKLMFIGCLLAAAVGCGQEGGSLNPYYDRMKKLAEEAKANPGDRTALDKLKRYATADSDYWNRSYAYGSLGELAAKNVGGYQSELIPLFDKLLKDSDPGLRRRGAETILSIGPNAVSETLPSLISIVQQGKEDDVTWFSARALGMLETRKEALESLPVLLRAAGTPPPAGTQDSAPQVRYYALNSIKELATRNKLDVIPQLEELLSASVAPYKERVAKTILKLDSSNRAAQRVITN